MDESNTTSDETVFVTKMKRKLHYVIEDEEGNPKIRYRYNKIPLEWKRGLTMQDIVSWLSLLSEYRVKGEEHMNNVEALIREVDIEYERDVYPISGWRFVKSIHMKDSWMNWLKIFELHKRYIEGTVSLTYDRSVISDLHRQAMKIESEFEWIPRILIKVYPNTLIIPDKMKEDIPEYLDSSQDDVSDDLPSHTINPEADTKEEMETLYYGIILYIPSILKKEREWFKEYLDTPLSEIKQSVEIKSNVVYSLHVLL